MKPYYLLLFCAVIFTDVNAQTISFSLASGSPITSSNFMRCLLAKDLNNDGNKDLLVGTGYGTNINTFHGNGAGQFSATSVYSLSGNGTIAMAMADFNADNLQDIAIANYNTNNVSVMHRSTSGSFTNAVNATYTIGNQPYSVDVADFNMDGHLDIICCSANGYNVFIWQGNGSGTFASTPSFSLSTPPVPYHVCAGYFNQDGFPDFAYVSGTTNQLFVYLNNGAGSFSAASGSPYTTGTEPRTISAGDLNNDGFTDLVVPNAQSNNLSLFLGAATGSFTAASGSPISVGNYPYQVGIADFDFNGTKDMVVACAGSNAMYRLSGNGNATFSSGGTPLPVGNMPQSLVADDFNNDGKTDVAVADWGGSDIHVFLNTNTTCPVSSAFAFTTQANGAVNFSSASTGTSSGTSYSWNFGNGNTATGASVSQAFTTGVYTVTLTASNSSLCSSMSVQTISVCILAPSFTYSTQPNGQVTFYNSSTGIGNTSVFNWNFGDSNSAPGYTATHTYAPGTFVVTLTASDFPGCSASVSQTITVEVISAVSEYTWAKDVFIYPNPANDRVQLDLSAAEITDKCRVVLYSCTGAEVLRAELQPGINSISLAQLPPGVYGYQLIAREHSIKAGKLVVQEH